MGEFQAMRKYFAIFLALVACHVSILVHGREIKPLSNTNTVRHRHTPLPKTTIVTASPAERNIKSSPVTPKYVVAGSEDSVLIPNDVNAFRPTTPGNSPGVGHRKFVAIQSPYNVRVSVTKGFKNDFAPTDPGHSPGVGHPIQH